MQSSAEIVIPADTIVAVDAPATPSLRALSRTCVRRLVTT